MSARRFLPYSAFAGLLLVAVAIVVLTGVLP